MMRYAFGVEYNGAKYSGWQRQKLEHVIGVQQRLEEAIAVIADQPVSVVCAGRTDTGVHATGQVVHFDVSSVRSEKSWFLGCNSNLNADISVKWAVPVAEDFNARYSAEARRYRYIIYNDRARPALFNDTVTHYYKHELDANKMHLAAQAIQGTHDFTTFRATHCQAKTSTREVSHIRVERFGKYIVIDIQANAFLHHMVRNIVGSLIEVGAGIQPVNWITDLLLAKDRTLAAATAKPNGLYLVRVIYPEKWQLPTRPMGPLFLAD